MSLLQGIQVRKASRVAAHSTLDRGDADVMIREVERAELRGSMITAFEENEVSGQTKWDLLDQEDYYETLDVARIKYKAAVEAYNIRREGDAAYMASVSQTINGIFSAMSFGLTASRYMAAQEALKKMPELNKMLLENLSTRESELFSPDSFSGLGRSDLAPAFDFTGILEQANRDKRFP